MGVDVTRDKEHAIVKFSGKCTIEQAAEIHAAILGAFERASTITFDLSEMKKADLSLLQILAASHLEAQKRSVKFKCASSSSVLSDVVKEAGFQCLIPCRIDSDGTCTFWAEDTEREGS